VIAEGCAVLHILEQLLLLPLLQNLTDRFYPKAKAGGLKNGDLMELEGGV
jgi:hypothetical protein